MKLVRTIQVGLGLIGSTVVEQIVAAHDGWKHQIGLDVRVSAILTTRGALVAGPDGFSAEQLTAIVTQRRAGSDLPQIGAAPGLRCVTREDFDPAQVGVPRWIVLDAASGSETSALATASLRLGGAVVYSNKAPLSQPMPAPAELWEGARNGAVRYEATCGAGLPVISTIASLRATGDTVTGITGCLSGTLGAIFSDIASGESLSSAIRAAKDAGYTEPDPRDDLSGLDVARKALILARTIGRTVDLDDIAVESLVPDSLADCSVDEFLERIGQYNGPIAARQQEASAQGATLKYVATVTADGAIRVGIESVPTSTVLGALQGPENIISIWTNRYDQYPLTISGPGAGAAVTAAGMIADMLELARAGYTTDE